MHGDEVKQAEGKTVKEVQTNKTYSYGHKCVEIVAIVFTDGSRISFEDATDPVIGRYDQPPDLATTA